MTCADPGPSDSMMAYSANVASYNLYLTNTGKERIFNRSTAKFNKSISQGASNMIVINLLL